MPPLYLYRCPDRHETEKLCSVSEHSGTIVCSCGKRARQVITATHIHPDISPYRSAVTGEMIGGRAGHREHLRRHNLVEIGNEPIRKRKRDPLPALGPDIKRAIDQIKAHGVPEADRVRR
jgi:hypothetical protein